MASPASRTTRMRILVIEDDDRVRDELARGLTHEGFEVAAAASSARGEELLEGDAFALVVLDLGLPDGHGFDLLKRHAASDLPVIVLTARIDVDTRVRAFALGAADFLAKPFFLAELVARIRARIGGALPGGPGKVEFADVVVDLVARTVHVAGALAELTPGELDILEYLVSRPGRAVSRGTLASSALDSTRERFDRTIDSHISRLRTKLGPLGRDHIHTVWGIGWRFDLS
jgi:DNA-binding response OmpR family regulator